MVNIGIPIAGSIDASGTATLETLPTESFTWTGADVTIAGEMSANTFKNAFVLSEETDNGVAELTVAMALDGSGIFMAALKALLDGGAKYVDAAGGDPAGFSKAAMVEGSSTLQAYLESYAQAQIDADLASNGIPANVEAEHVINLALSHFGDDASAGVVALWNAMNAANKSANMNIIARQIPRSRYGEEFASDLKVMAGDVITFRFNVTQQYKVSQKEADATGAGVLAELGTPAEPIYPGVNGAYGAYFVNSRAVDLKITLA
jgi:hypothetical protein